MRTSKLFLLLFLSVFLSGNKLNSQSFVHPGCLHNQADLNRMRDKVNANQQPWRSGWDKLIANPRAQSSWNASPVSIVYRGNDQEHAENFTGLMRDCHAAYLNALRYRISGNTAYADNAVRIMNAWSSTLTDILGWTEQTLAEGIYGYIFANAGELMRGYSGWSSSDFNRFKNMLRDHFAWPSIWFLDPNAPENGRYGTCITHYWANWGLSAIASAMSIGILCDDRTLYNEALYYYKQGPGNEAINRLVPFVHTSDLGQWQESGRDQAHSLMGVGLAATICEMAWKQGEDLYALNDHRLYKGMNYVASYNLGNNVPYSTYNNCDNVNQTVISTNQRGEVRPIWEMIYNHYANRLGWNVPYFKQWADQLRPEGGGGDYNPNSGGYDQIGFGTLTFTLDAAGGGGGDLVTGVSGLSGTFQIKNRATGMVIDGYGKTGNGDAVSQQASSTTSPNSHWQIIDAGSSQGAFYYLQNVGTGMKMDGYGRTTNGDNVAQYASSTTHINAQWVIQQYNGYYRIQNRGTGMFMDGVGRTANGDPLSQYANTTHVNAQWELVTVGSSSGGTSLAGIYNLQNRTTGLMLDGMGRTTNGDACGQWASGNSSNQRWSVEASGSNYKLRNVATGLYLDGMGRTTNGDDVGQWAGGSSTNQQWSLEATSGHYKLRNVATGLYLDGMERTTNGSACGQWAGGSSYNQQWGMVSVSSAPSKDADQFNTSDITVYPNPVSSVLTVELPIGFTQGKAKILDLSGKTVLENALTTEKLEMDITGLKSGIYFLQVSGNDLLWNRKFIKE